MKTYALTLLLLISFSALASADQSSIGSTVEDFTLSDHLGTKHSLSDWKDRKAIVIVFLGTECPLAKLYANRLQELADRFKDKPVQIVGINANSQDTLQEIGHYVRTHQLQFPVLKDAGNRVADAMNAQRTPEAFLLDDQFVVRYRGRIDDQYGVGYSRANYQRQDLAEAIDETLKGDKVSKPFIAAVGCHIGRTVQRKPSGNITYCKQISRLLQKHCVECHRPGQIAPFTLTDFDDVTAWAETLREVMQDNRMPPWHANPKHGEFINDARMTTEEKTLFYQWVDNGMPLGDRSDLPDPIQYSEDWQIGEPDVVFKMPEEFSVPAKGIVPYQYFYLDTKFEEDMWVKASEFRPGNRSVVHHGFLFYLPPGQEHANAEDPLFNTVATFAPGVPAGAFQDGLARLVPAGSRLGFQIHYTPNGSKQTDRSEVGLVFVQPDKVQQEVKIKAAINLDFEIPPGARDYVINAGYSFTQETFVHALSPHMHYRGRSFRFTAQYPDGSEEIVLDVPQYDFNWQNSYVLRKPKLMPEGTVMMCRGVFDNSERNLVNPDPTKTVYWGDQSWDEMMLGSLVTSLGPNVRRGEFPKVKPIAGDLFEVTFRYMGDENTKSVYVAGSFNDWDSKRHPMQELGDEKGYVAKINLKRGQHQYKFVVNGNNWLLDPENPNREGPFDNTVVRVR